MCKLSYSYLVSYAPSGRAKCYTTGIKIAKGALRISFGTPSYVSDGTITAHEDALVVLKVLGGRVESASGEAYGVCGCCAYYAEVVATCDGCAIDQLCGNCASTEEEQEDGTLCPSCLESATGTD
jgi:hypothetical protein